MYDRIMLQVGQIKTAVRRLEYPVRCRRLPGIFDLRFEVFLAELFVGKKTCFDAIKRVTGERVIIEIPIFRIERDAVRCDLGWRLLLLVN